MILIISDNYDQSTNKVIDWLKYYNAEYLRINETTKIHVTKISIKNKELKILLRIEDTEIDLDQINSVWYRRGHINIKRYVDVRKINEAFKEISSQIINHLNIEVGDLVEYITYILNKKRTINSANKPNLNKLICLDEARQVGLLIPDTLITSEKRFVDSNGSLITKSISNSPNFIDFTRAEEFHCSTKLVSAIKLELNFFPSLLQQNLVKDFEVRTFFLNGKFYSCAFFSQKYEKSKIDFRCGGNQIRKVPFGLPYSIRTKLSSLIKKLDINCGTIDIIYHNRKYYFLEINPVGQFEDVSYYGNYNLERIIADELINNEN